MLHNINLENAMRCLGHDILLEEATLADKAAHPVVHIAKAVAEKQIVYGVVYAPGEVDAHGEAMMAEDIEKMCHEFLRLAASTKGAVIDKNHDNVALSAYPVESYIETEEGKDWPVGSWIMGVKIEDPTIWAEVKSGKLNGYSFEAMVRKLPIIVEVDLEPDFIGTTSKNLQHDHVFFLEFNEEGLVVGGSTSYDDGHRHVIRAGTATEFAKSSGGHSHSHRLPV